MLKGVATPIGGADRVGTEHGWALNGRAASDVLPPKVSGRGGCKGECSCKGAMMADGVILE